jgi:phosphoglycerate kinase
MKGNLPTVSEADVAEKRVVVRVDLDMPNAHNPRVTTTEEIIKWLLEKKAASIKAIGHRGEYLIIHDLRQKFPSVEWSDRLRDDAREKENNINYAGELAGDCEVYINEAFAVSHRVHTSIVALPKMIKERGGKVFAGLRFAKEIASLDQVWTHPGWKVLVIGGAKAADKAEYAMKLAGKVDRVMVGGLLPQAIEETAANIYPGILREDEKDLTDETIADFCKQISAARIIILAGPMGRFEEPGSEKGTKEIFSAIAGSMAYKVAGGGNTEDALSKFGLTEKFDWISVGGGAMLEYLATGTLPGLEALL